MDRNSIYYKQVQLLIQVLPFVSKQKCFALKGGTAINLFVRDFPRLSVDIDLAIAMVVAGTTGIISTLVEGNVVDNLDTIAAEMILLALGMSADQAQQIAARPLISFDE